jgi:hypothetical protein
MAVGRRVDVFNGGGDGAMFALAQHRRRFYQLGLTSSNHGHSGFRPWRVRET